METLPTDVFNHIFGPHSAKNLPQGHPGGLSANRTYTGSFRRTWPTNPFYSSDTQLVLILFR